MKKIIHTIIVLSVSILISSCAQVQVVNIDKNNNTRTVKFTHDNGSIKFVNQKLSLKNNNWFEAECLEANFKKFQNCQVDKIIFTKKSIIKIANLKKKENDSSSYKKDSFSNQQDSSSQQEQSSNQEEETSNDEEEDDNDNGEGNGFMPPPPPGECGQEVC